MAYVTPPTFADGDVLSASQLNILATNQNYLSGIANAVNVGFRQIELTSASDWEYYSCIHAYEWLYVRYAPGDDLRIYASDDGYTAIVATVDTSTGVEAAIDISGEGFTPGAWITYGLRGTDGDTMTIQYFAEDDGDRTA